MTYEFNIDRENGTWTAYNPDGQQIDSGDLPLDGVTRRVAILDDHGVGNPVRDALQAIFSQDWEQTGDVPD